MPATAAASSAPKGANVTIAEMQAALDAKRAAFKREGPPELAHRKANLRRLRKAILAWQDDIAAAISRDFTHRSRHETLLAEVMLTANTVKYAERHLREWMRPRSRFVGMNLFPATAKVHYQPKGVVGIIAPWNYPFNLAISPLASALAAGNRAMIKPSEHTPETSALMAEMMAELFPADEVSVWQGGPDVGAAFASLPLDHLLFTGGTEIGRKVYEAAAHNLVPVTLELGGKSPAIIGEDYPIDAAAVKIMSGKWLNAGQTCIATDYVMVPEGKLDRFVEAATAATAELYPRIEDNPDYTAINNEGHAKRLRSYLDDARAKGAEIVEINPAGEPLPKDGRKMAPTLVLGADESMKVLQDEMFGPIMAVKPYKTLDEAIDYVNDHDRPLALYYFDRDRRRTRKVLERTTSGGAAINETVFHFAVDSLPFGGVGPSGLGGAVHAREGFETFSHKKSMFYQSRINGAFLLRPPFGKLTEMVLKALS